MDDQTPVTIERRFTRLERENRWWKLLGVTALALVGLVIWLRPASGRESIAADEVRAMTIRLVDRNGTVVGKLDGTTGRPALQLFGPNGQPQILLAVSSTGGTGYPALYLIGPDGHLRILLSVSVKGLPQIQILHEGEKRGMSLDADTLTLRDRNEQARFSARVPTDEQAVLSAFDKNGQVIWQIP